MYNFFDIMIYSELDKNMIKTFQDIFLTIEKIYKPPYRDKIHFEMGYFVEISTKLVCEDLVKIIESNFNYNVNVIISTTRISRIEININDIILKIQIRNLQYEFIKRGDKFDLILFDIYKKRDIYEYLGEKEIMALKCSLMGRYKPMIQTMLIYNKK